MSIDRYLVIHKDQPLSVKGPNAGAETATLGLVRALTRIGGEVCLAARFKDCSEADREAFSVFALDSAFRFDLALEDFALGGSFHLIVVGRAAALISSQSCTAVVSRTLICPDPSPEGTGMSLDAVDANCDQVICVSEAQKQLFVESGFPEQKLKVVYNGVDGEIFFSDREAQQRDWNRLVFSGALVRDKGLHVLLEAFAELKAEFSELSLDIFGAASLWGREEYLNIPELQSAIPGIQFHGKVSQEEIANTYRRSGLCIVPSIWFDALNLTSLEAQSCGCPVVAFRVGGIPEGIVDGTTGIVAGEPSSENLKVAIRSILQDRERHQQMSRQAGEITPARFSWEKNAKEVRALCREAASHKLIQSKLGVATTWNQPCGLASNMRFLLEQFDQDEYVVFAEDHPLADPSKDESNVVRCWERSAKDWGAFVSAIRQSGIQVLILNAQPEFYAEPVLWEQLKELREETGLTVVMLLHNVYTLKEKLRAQLVEVDHLIVHSPENRQEAIANGISPERISVMPLGVYKQTPLSAERRAEIRSALNVAPKQKLIFSNGFLQPHKGFEDIIEAVATLDTVGIDAKLLIAGGIHDTDKEAIEYLEDLQGLIEKFQLHSRVTIIPEFIPEEQLFDYLGASDCVVLNYLTNHFESSGVGALAMGAGVPVMTSTAPPFRPYADAVWKVTSGFPMQHSLYAVLSTDELSEDLREKSNRYAERNSWSVSASRLRHILKGLQYEVSNMEKENAVEKAQDKRASTQLKVLFWNRPNALSQPGGDTVVMNRTADGLRSIGVEVAIDCARELNPADFDVVHLFNFALPELLERDAQACEQAGTPFVVTTLCEDVAAFHNQSIAVYEQLREYWSRGQLRDWWRDNYRGTQGATASPSFANNRVATTASALLTNGPAESAVLKRLYGDSVATREVYLGCDTQAGNPDLFYQKFGERDFVLCVGRLETRKNQLMLLKALEDVDVTVVLAAGGFSYQPEYERAVREFQRKGKTLILERLDDEMLASAYAAAKVHVLPSWYELPGLVSLEAARANCQIVVSDTGTTRDYLGDSAFYCDPSSPESVANAVLAAMYTPSDKGAAEQSSKYTWEQTASQTYAVYKEVAKYEEQVIEPIAKEQSSAATFASAPVSAQPAIATQPAVAEQPQTAEAREAQKLTPEVIAELEKAEETAREHKYEEAIQAFEAILAKDPECARALRGIGAVRFTQGRTSEARGFFERSLTIDVFNPRNLCGVGMCYMADKRPADAYEYFVRALKEDPTEIVAILQLMECAYTVGEFGDLENALRAYLAENPSELNMQYSLAGCLFASKKYEESERIARGVLETDRTHAGALELLDKIAEKRQEEESLPRDVTPQEAASVPSAAAKAEDADKPAGVGSGTNSAAAARLKRLVGGVTPQQAANEPKPSAESAETKVASASVPLGQRIEVERIDPRSTHFDSIDTKIADVEEFKRRKQFDEAFDGVATLLQMASISDSQREAILTLRADLLALTGEIAEGEQQYRAVIENNPRAVKAMCGLGAVEASRANWEQAVSLFEQALAVDPRCDIAMAGKGMHFITTGDHDAAWSSFHQALEINPENSRALFGVIELGHSMGRLEQVEQALSNYLEMHPGDLNILYSLAGCYYAQDRIDEAKEEIAKITLLDPSHEMARELEQVIAASGA